MTEILGPDLDDLKPGDLLRVVTHSKKDYRIEKIVDDKEHRLLVLNLREPLYRTLKARATLFDKSIEQEVIDVLDENMQGWVEIAASDEFEIQLNEGTKSKKGKSKGRCSTTIRSMEGN